VLRCHRRVVRRCCPLCAHKTRCRSVSRRSTAARWASTTRRQHAARCIGECKLRARRRRLCARVPRLMRLLLQLWLAPGPWGLGRSRRRGATRDPRAEGKNGTRTWKLSRCRSSAEPLAPALPLSIIVNGLALRTPTGLDCVQRVMRCPLLACTPRPRRCHWQWVHACSGLRDQRNLRFNATFVIFL
jgi:hypothetical protein